MLRLTSQLTRSFSQAKIPLQLSYPFEHTLNSQQFAFMDIRFTQIPFSRELWPPQRQHICLVLKSFEERLNNNRQQGEMDKFITKRLKDRAEQLKDIAKEAQFQLRFSLDEKSVVKSTGYYEIKPEAGLSLDEKVIEDIHNYKFSRDNEVLTVSMKEKKVQLNSQEQLKKDMLDKMGGEQSREIKEQFEKMSVSKHAVVYNQLIQKFLSIGKKEKKNTKFQPYYIVDQIKGQFSCQMHHQGSVYSDEALEFDSKWLYYVTNLQSNDLKKYRRRTLFDFQYWSRGSFFPIRNFASEVIQQ